MNKEVLISELTYKAIRSSGAGGQHVNKVSSKVVLSFDLANSGGVSAREKRLLYKAIGARLTKENVLILSCDESKSQPQNKKKVIERFLDIITRGLFVPKRRIATKPTKGSVKRTKEKKQKRSDVKKLRKKPSLD